MKRLKHWTQKVAVGLLMVGVFFASSAQVAYAQWATTNPDLLANDLANTIQEESKSEVKGALLGALAGVGISLLDYVATLTAQSTAVWIANGAAGQHPLFNSQTIEEVGQAVAANVVSDVLDQIVPGAGSLAAIGIDPNNPDVTGVLRKLLGSPYQPVQLTEDGRLDGGSIGRNFSSYIASTAAIAGAGTQAGGEAGLKILADTMNAASFNEFYGLLQTYGQTQARAGNVAAVQQYKDIINASFQDLKSPISDRSKWPAALVKKKLDDAITNKQQNDADVGKGLVQAAGENAVIQVGINFLTTFAGTLLGELTNKLFDGLLDGVGPVTVNPFDPTDVSPGRSGEELFRSLGTFKPLDVTGYSLIAELASCPTTLIRNSRGIYTCAMNTAFVTVVTRGNSPNPSTVREAIESGELNGDWPLIGPGAALNKDPGCFRRAFCHSNLMKLRKARIIPIGWEMAAEMSGEGKHTLNEVMDGFYDCNSEGTRDAAHPFCKLIDPNWILRAPEAVCRTLGYGQQLASSAGAERAQECVDIQTCLEEGPNGECLGGYGYCVREKNIWRFRGDACQASQASCQALVDRDGIRVSYLLNTVNYAECGPDKTGCQWYETEKTIDTEGNFDWPNILDVVEDETEDFTNTSRIHTDRDVELCNEGGCRALVSRENGIVFNVIQNGSFEDDDNSDRFPDYWTSEARGRAQLITGLGVAGGVGLRFGFSDEEIDASPSPVAGLLGGDITNTGIQMHPSYDYTFTVRAKLDTDITSGNLETEISLSDDNPNEGGSATIDFDSYRVEAGQEETECVGSSDGKVSITRLMEPTDDFVTVSCTFTAPNLPDTIRQIAGVLSIEGTRGLIIDDVQLEQNPQSSEFAFGYSRETASRVYAKVPPTYLGCTGGENDPAACENYAKVCSPADQGCRLYTPTNGDPAVSAVVGEGNACPAACVGYDTYKQEPTFYEPEGVFPNYFIPATADTCSADAAGCDEFTNLTTEGREYYSYLRACNTTDRVDDQFEAIYYTWEGTDTEGYQIKTWNLLQSNTSAGFSGNDTFAPCTLWEADSENIECIEGTGAATGWRITPGGDYELDLPEACNERADIFTNPDCREFYDTEGRIHYREWSKTVTVNDACTSYRKTTTAGDTVVQKRGNCGNSGGYFEDTTGSCIYYGYSEESDSCSEQENGCRLYTGGRGNNSRIVLNEIFESGEEFDAGDPTAGTIPGWDTGDRNFVTRSRESLANEGHSIKIEDGRRFWTYFAKIDGVAGPTGIQGITSQYGETCLIEEGESSCGAFKNSVFQGKTYTISFWAKGDGYIRVGFDKDPAVNTPAEIDIPRLDVRFEAANGDTEIPLTSEWKEYRLGPLDMNGIDHPDFGENTILLFAPVAGSTEMYIDNIVLREGEEDIALIRDSWSTPAVCDANPAGDYVPQYNLGCREYEESTGDTVYLRSFSRLCSEDKVGCTGFYDMQASESPYGQVFNAYCTRVLSPGALDSQQECYLETDETGLAYDLTSPRLCTIQPGNESCRFNYNAYIPEVNLDSNRMAHIQYESDTEIVKPDMPIYAVVNEADQCNVANDGCTEVGVPILSADQSRVESWETTNLLLDPDTYGEALCYAKDLFCEEYTAPDQGKYYFKDPQQKVCEYKESVRIDGQAYSGWFVEGTTNFCYGEGSCEVSGASCVLDSDCAPIIDAAVPGAGTCSVFGAACSQDSDCRLNERCMGVESDKCIIDSGTYIVSGTKSEIWRNGDEEYNGWVGTCDPSHSGCREFLDPLDGTEADAVYGQTEPRAYYYIENDNLGDNSILTNSRRCNGQMSTEEGCVLFNDTSIPELSFSTAATSIASEYADELYGTRKFDLVTPINCDAGAARSTITTPSGETIDLCANRCVYDQFKVNDIGDVNYVWRDGRESKFSSLRQFLADDQLDPGEGGQPLLREDLEKAYIFGGSCIQDIDCAPIRSESGNAVEGGCRSFVYTTDAEVDGNTTPVIRLSNDTNRVLKVNRNRACAEWISPDECRLIWDEDLGRYRNSCASVILCQEYDEEGITGCAKPKLDDPAIVISSEVYSERDASWYGKDYSGYAIPNQIQLQHLTQETVTPQNICIAITDNKVQPALLDGQIVECTTDATVCGAIPDVSAICGQNPDPEYALAYNAGSCDMEDPAVDGFGGTCNVGYCANTGSACTTSDACPGSECIVGVCISAVEIAIPGGGSEPRRCTQNADCGVGAVCNAGVCEVENGDFCDIESLLAGDATIGCGLGNRCRTSRAWRTGSCMNDNCLLTPKGERFTAGSDIDEVFTKVCRANPEIDSPFGNEVVEGWSLYDGGPNNYEVEGPVTALGDNEKNGYAYDVRSGFENANICTWGEACSCSYKKVAGSSGASQYVEIDTSLIDLTEMVAASLNAPDSGSLGICSGGVANGAFCIIQGNREYGCKPSSAAPSVDEPIQAGSGAFGTCNPINREEEIVGLKGYCLERDSAISVKGDPNIGACLTYFPIDELRGETDLYGKAKEAGAFEELNYCTFPQTFVNLGPFIGCVEPDFGITPSNDPDNLICPNNYITVHTDYNGDDNGTGFCDPTGASGYLIYPNRWEIPDTPYDKDSYNIAEFDLNAALYWDNTRQVTLQAYGDDVLGYMCIPQGAVMNDGTACSPSEIERMYPDIVAGRTATRVRTHTDIDTSTLASMYNELYRECRAYGLQLDGLGSSSEAVRSMRTFMSQYLLDSYGPIIIDGIDGNEDSGRTYSTPSASAKEEVSSAPAFIASFDNDGGGLPQDRRDLMFSNPMLTMDIYPACSEVLQIANSDNAFVYTNRIKQGQIGGADLTINITEDIKYDKETKFGATANPRDFTSTSSPIGGGASKGGVPIPIPTCRDASLVDPSSPRERFVRWRFLSALDGIFGMAGSLACGSGYELGFAYESGDPDEIYGYPYFQFNGGAPRDRYPVYFPDYGSGTYDYPDIFESPVTSMSTDSWVFIRKLTAMPTAYWEWVAANGSYSYRNTYALDNPGATDFPGVEYDARAYGDSSHTPAPPVVYPVDFSNCTGRNCREGTRRNTFSVNGETSQTFTVDSEGFFRATVEFFAAADKEQLPLRNIMVKWSDHLFAGGTSPDQADDDNYYKNHRGLDGDDQEICEENNEWGKTALSCQAGWLTFQYTYVCNELVATQLPACSGDVTTDCFDGSFCVFQPKVQLRDNWGWCSGVCTEGRSGESEPGCFSPYEVTSINPNDNNECAVFMPTEEQSGNNPWIPYGGVIRIREQ